MEDLSKKICLCGDSGVGKTSLIRQFVSGKYDEKYLSTLGTVVSKKSLYFPEEDCRVNLMIWDISGQAEFKHTHSSGFKSATGALIVCDVTRPETVKNIGLWLSNLRRNTNAQLPAVILLNKYDLLDLNSNKKAEIDELLKVYDVPRYYTSAKTGFNVEESFQVLSKGIIETKSTFSKIMKESLVMGKTFDKPTEYLDYMAVTFCRAFGDEQVGMNIVRQQVLNEGIDFEKITFGEAKVIIKRLVSVIKDEKGSKVAKDMKKNLVEAYRRYET